MVAKINRADFARSKVLREHSQRSKEVARALDANAAVLPHARVFTSVQFEEFVTQLTPKRFELLRLAIKRSRSINELASASHREPSAVSRDVAKLQALGLVKVELVANPGHGHMKIVTPVATRIAIDANLQAA
jgi:predicted transcriptional regulator